VLTFEYSITRLVEHFCKAIAHWAMRSVDERMESGGGWRYVTSEMSRGISGCKPVIVKYGEQAMHSRTVTLSAQKTECAPTDHLVWSLSMALKRDCRTLKCALSTRPFA
jgi:hypothetical protein